MRYLIRIVKEVIICGYCGPADHTTQNCPNNPANK